MNKDIAYSNLTENIKYCLYATPAEVKSTGVVFFICVYSPPRTEIDGG